MTVPTEPEAMVLPSDSSSAVMIRQRTSWLSTQFLKLFIRATGLGQEPPIPRPLSQGPWPHDAGEFLPPDLGTRLNVSVEKYQFEPDAPLQLQYADRWTPYIIRRVNPASPTRRTLIYTPGGAFIYMANAGHWELAAYLANVLEADVVLQTYTLIPFAGVRDVLPPLVEIYRRIYPRVKAQDHELVMGGESAGGSVSMCIVVALHQAGIPLPDQMMLIAPWLDLTAMSPDGGVNKHDPLLTFDMARRYGRLWGSTGAIGEEQFRIEERKLAPMPTVKELKRMAEPLASPLFWDLTILANAGIKLTICTGGHDTLVVDGDAFFKRCKEANVQVTYIRGDDCIHGYPMLGHLPIAKYLFRESKTGLELIVKSVKRYSKL